MKNIIFFICLLFVSDVLMSQDIDKISKILGAKPLLFVDSIESDLSKLQTLDPYNVANIEILKPKTARKTYGIRGNDGAMNIITKPLAKLCYWRFLGSVSPEYLKAVPTPESDTSIVYILNDSVMTLNPSGNLYLLNKKNFRRLKILTRSDLSDQYGIDDKRMGVWIRTKKKWNKINS